MLRKESTITIYRYHLCFLLRFTDIFSIYAWVIPLKDKRGIIITNAFKKVFKRI